MPSLRLGIDLDGVLADFVSAFNALAFDLLGVQAPPADCWDYMKKGGMTRRQEEQLWDHVRDSPNFWSSLQPYSETPRVLPRLASTTHAIYFITSRRSPTAKVQSEDWLMKMGHPRPTVCISSQKGLLCRALRITHFLDDHTANVQQVLTDSPATSAYLLTRPWNRPLDGVQSISTVEGFLESVGL